MSVCHIDIGRDFSPKLGPRYIRLGPFSGEDFRDRLLEPAFLKYDEVVIHLDSLAGISASFFEEAFGGLVRLHSLAPVRQKLRFVTTTRNYLVGKINNWMDDAERDRKKGKS